MKPLDIRLYREDEFPHLPAGREPGAQTLRNRTQRTVTAPFVAVVGTAMFAAGVWVAAGGRGARFDRQEELFGGLFFVAFGLLALFVGLSMWDKGRPARHPRLRGVTLSVAGDTLRRGEEVSVAVAGLPAADGRLEVGLACDERCDTEIRVRVRGVSTVRRQTGETTIHEQWQPAPPGADERAFTFRVPRDVPYSYEGDCLSYAWRVSARAVRPLRKDARVDRPIWIDP